MAISPETEHTTEQDFQLTLKINEIFTSLQGESLRSGIPTIFIRLTGCPLRCSYCDTEYAFYEGNKKSINEIIKTAEESGLKYVCITGGEPLAQKNCLLLMKYLCDGGFHVSLETGGAMDITHIDDRVLIVLDIKTPGSGEEKRNLVSNLAQLKETDEIKFVICDRSDYEWSRQFIGQHMQNNKCPVLFSPSHQQLSARELAEWIISDRLPVRLQIQLHKILWGDEPGR